MNRVEITPAANMEPQGQHSLVLPPHLAAAKQELFDTYDARIEQSTYIPPIDSELKIKRGVGIYIAGSYVVRCALDPRVSLESYVDGMVGGIGLDKDGLEQLAMARRNPETNNVDQVWSHYMAGTPRNHLRTKDIAHYDRRVFETTLGTLKVMDGLKIDGNGANTVFQPDRIGIVDYSRGVQSLAEKVDCIADDICYGGIKRLLETPEEQGEMAGRLPVLRTLLKVCVQAERNDKAWQGSADAVDAYVKLLDNTGARAPHPLDEPVEPFEWGPPERAIASNCKKPN
jgi:hypothetical protein